MPGPVATSTARLRRWASEFDRIVTDDCATIDYTEQDLIDEYLDQIRDDHLQPLLTTAVEVIRVPGCSLTEKVFLDMADSCPNLSELDAAWCELLTDDAIIAIAQKSPLRALCILGCKQVTNCAIEAVASCNIAKLNVWHCEKLPDRALMAVAGPSLTDLKAGYRPNLTDAAIIAVATNSPHLEELNVRG